MSEIYQLYRYINIDGSAKEWAWRRRADGTLEVRWGRAGRLVQQRLYPASHQEQLFKTIAGKIRKGYVDLGWRPLTHHASRQTRPTAAGATHPAPAGSRTVSSGLKLDWSRLVTDVSNDWF
ncbi:MAG: hypothetical protein MZV65_21950 [Chromatiales bacterium]|nr:hypothetical protein [Chromatiales bacterium]